MPMFSKSKGSADLKSTISRPMPYNPPGINGYRGETPLMQIPQTPPPVPGRDNQRSRVTPNQIIDMYNRPDDDSTYSPSEYSIASSTSSPTLPPNSHNLGRFPGGAVHAPLPYIPQRPAMPQPQCNCNKQLPPPPPVPVIPALSRGLSQHYTPPSRPMMLSYLAPQVVSQPQVVRTRTDTRRQGEWLARGTTRFDPEELRQQEKEVRRQREKVEKQERKAEKKMIREAIKVERAEKR